MTNYPQEIESKLDFLVESVKQMETEEFPMREEFIRETFGEALFEQWLAGSDENPFDEDQFRSLLKMVVAKSILQEMIDTGIVDSVDDGSGNEFVFVTPLGKALRESVMSEDDAKKMSYFNLN